MKSNYANKNLQRKRGANKHETEKKWDAANVSVCNIVLMAVAKCNFPSRCCRLLTMVDNRKKSTSIKMVEKTMVE